jgi:hypothetical protein
MVEAFVPIAYMLGQFAKKTSVTDPGGDGPFGCEGQNECNAVDTSQDALASKSGPSLPSIKGRALFIGLEATLSDAPVNVLLLADKEKDHTNYAPMDIEALVADRFVPIVADDTTRALGESGVLSMAFALQPTPSALFGEKDLTWLRLVPKSSNDDWKPSLRGAYLNAVWASAKETLTRELLGSSDGSPGLTVRLARPPVLRNTLELRVREPLGEEELESLRRKDSADAQSRIDSPSIDNTAVKNDVDSLPGYWVLWTQVIDPDDEPATARVYALDETTGEIRFGNGLHGMIPPIGRDSIVAFRYCRTEADPTGNDGVPGNSIGPRTILNLVSPVESVESVIAADQSAGGAPPESDERVLRFGFSRLRHRNRAVTAHDIEDLALQSSPDIVQARALVRRGYLRLVVVMRGKNPQPNTPQVRELSRLLLDAAPLSLSSPRALRIVGPKVRKLRIDLKLLVTILDRAGELSAYVNKTLTEFFDTSIGGADGDGWPLGAPPSDDDIAFALRDAPHLESIKDVTLRENTDDGELHSWVTSVKTDELVMLAKDPIGIEFITVEVAA